MESGFSGGIDLFNQQKFLEALEAVWLEAQGEEKVFLQGLIQIAAAFHHLKRGNPAGMRLLLEEGWKKLARFGDVQSGLDLAALRSQLQPWREFFSRVATVPPTEAPRLPRIELSAQR